MTPRLLIVGASGRAAAVQALRAGFTPFVIDLFADADTQRLAETLKCDDYPHGFVELAKRLPRMPWMYTGGLENYPDIVAAISERHELWGNGPDVLRKVREPEWLAKTIPHTCYPEVARLPQTGKRWLRKPRSGSAGHGIRFANDDDDTASDSHIYQEWIEGESRSAVFLSDGRNSVLEAEFLQLIGTPWLHARDFQYAGNIGPLNQTGISSNAYRYLHVASRLAESAGLRGIWGFDLIEQSGAFRVIEVNPRLPASLELAMWSRGVLSLMTHQEIFESTDALSKRKFWMSWPTVVGKAIYYAPHRIRFPATGPWEGSLANCTSVTSRPDFADIPHSGTVIEKGQPVFTLFAEADTPETCLTELKRRAAEMDVLFTPD